MSQNVITSERVRATFAGLLSEVRMPSRTHRASWRRREGVVFRLLQKRRSAFVEFGVLYRT